METAQPHSVAKRRTPSRCREWERNRRNKFNDAITRLGDIVKQITKSNDTSKDSPKVEIVEKAIICLSSIMQERTQLKAEILALQVRIDAKKENTKDASTQVFIGFNKKRKNSKYVRVVMLDKPERNALKEKPVLTTNVTVESKVDKPKPVEKCTTKTSTPPKVPTILPKTINKKGPENTIVVLPATPYIFPQRPFLFPTVPPAFLLVDSNLQTLNKPPYPVVNRNNGDVTKTTMVNILPISAYSRPLSASKSKKNNSKSKNETLKKSNKKPKQSVKVIKENKVNSNDNIVIRIDETTGNNKTDGKSDKTALDTSHIHERKNGENDEEKDNKSKNTEPGGNQNVTDIEQNVSVKTTVNSNSNKHSELNKESEQILCAKVTVNDPPTTETELPDKIINVPVSTGAKQIDKNNTNSENKTKTDKKLPEKDKENKLPNILDTALCESTVDGGNARLELAEELLAASPTAAFLMSFPLVSGNRADSPAEDTAAPQINTKENNSRRNDGSSQTLNYFAKPDTSEMKTKESSKTISSNSNTVLKLTEQHKYSNTNITSKQMDPKSSNTIITTSCSDNPFLNLSISSLIPSSCTLTDSTFAFDFDCTTSKSVPSQSACYVTSNNLFYKSDPFSTVKSTIYSTSSISSGHDFNSFGLYPCAMDKYASKNKSDYPNMEDSLMKIGSSRLTYDIDLGWSHKGFDFVNCTSASSTFAKDNILTTANTPYSASYNPFNPEFHVPLVSTSNKKDTITSKANSSFAETITSLYSQPTSLWLDEGNFYSNNSSSKSNKNTSYLPDHTQTNNKPSNPKHYDAKHLTNINDSIKASNTGSNQHITDKYTKKSLNKMHINWMTSEIRPTQTNCNPSHLEIKGTPRTAYNHLDHVSKKLEHNDANYFPISMPNFSSQSVQDDMQIWPSTRPVGTTEISIEPPPINLPTLVGDLALGPHDKKKTDLTNRMNHHPPDLQNCSNFFSVTQLMNRSSDNSIPRYQGSDIESSKTVSIKQNTAQATAQTTNDTNIKAMSRVESHVSQPCYIFNETKPNAYETVNPYSQVKTKTNKSDKSSKAQKNNYSAEALIRGAACNQNVNSAKFVPPSQKYNEFNMPQDSIAQVSHYPPVLDYSDNSYTGQQFSATTLYNSTNNSLPNSFYSNFMPGSGNLMSGNYTNGPFSSEFIDYNQSTDCNYSNHKYEELKMRNNTTIFQQDKVSSNYKSSRRESATKHKLECSKKDSNKKYQSKRAKLNTEVEEWNDSAHLLWQNKAPNKRHPNLMTEEIPFPNYVGNQMHGQYQPDFFNNHLMSSNMQSVGPNVDRSLASFPVTSRANFNLSTIFPEITMKVQ